MRNKGFTLIEMLITIAIIGILSAIALFGLQGVREQARDGKRKSDLELIRSGLETYRSDCNIYPAAGGGTGQLNIGGTLTGSNNPATSCPSANIYIQRVPNDPQSPARTYRYNRLAGNTTYELCAVLENPPTTTPPLPQAGQCAGGCTIGACNYRVTSP